MSAERIAVLNHKGGVGKTTTTVNLGAGLAMLGKKVLLIDLDPQAHLTYSLGFPAHDIESSIYEVLRGEVSAADALLEKEMGVRKVTFADDAGHDDQEASPGWLTLRVLPGSLGLAGAERRLAAIPDNEILLREAVSSIVDSFDFVLIDCPPSLGVLTLNALVASEEVLVPVQSEYLAFQSLEKLLGAIEIVRDRHNGGLQVGGILVTRFDGRKVLNREVLSRLCDSFEPLLLDPVIRENIALAEAPQHGKDIFTYRPRSHGAEDYLRLCENVLRRQGVARQPAASASSAQPSSYGASAGTLPG